jgi:general nucleoside transport system permease protein
VKGRWLVTVLAPLAALVFSFAVASIALIAFDIDPWFAYGEMLGFAKSTESLINIVNRSVPLYVAGLAVAIGFRMGLFNIGVEGQYLLAALFAAWVGAQFSLPAVFHVAVILVVAVVVGAGWASIAALLKTKRGVHEVISTIMLNFIGFSVSGYLFLNVFRGQTGGLTLATRAIPSSGWIPSLNPVLSWFGVVPRAGSELHGFVIISILLGVGFHLLITKSRFGYDLRASGLNPAAAQASGVDPKRMILRTMMLSGGVAGLVGMSALLGFFHQYPQDFPRNYGFNGIAVALLGRNHPVGIALAALLWGFLERSSLILDLRRVPSEIVIIIQGTVVFGVVIAYEVISRVAQRRAVRAAALATADEETIEALA